MITEVEVAAGDRVWLDIGPQEQRRSCHRHERRDEEAEACTRTTTGW